MTNTHNRIAAIQKLVMAQQLDAALDDVKALSQTLGNDPGVLALHALILRRLDRPAEAMVLLQRVVNLNSRIPNAWLELARCHQALKNWSVARQAAETALALLPESPVALGLAFDIAEAQGDLIAADTWFARLARVDARAPDRRLALGNHCFDRNEFDQAIRHFSAFIHFAPGRIEGYLNLAAAYMGVNDPDSAAAALQDAMRHAPTDARPIARLCELDESRGLPPSERIAHCQAWLKLEPDNQHARLLLAYAHLTACEFQAARAALEPLVAVADSTWPALWVRAHYPANPIFPDRSAADDYRSEVRTLVDRLDRDLSGNRIDAALAGRMLAACPNYHLGYLNDTDQTLARDYAAVLRKLALCSGLQDANVTPHAAPNRARARIVIASAHFRHHSVSRVWRDLLCALPRDQFELCLAYLDEHEDVSTRTWRERADLWQQGKHDIPFWRDWIAEQQADIVVYPDLGMEPISQALASLRLAPVQVTTWGHPVSSGMATIDHFLSSDLAEPASAEAHYREHLVRIDGLAASYRFITPDRAGQAPAKRGFRLLCMQNAFKLMPEQDAAFARILEALPEAELHVIASTRGEALVSIETRLRAQLGASANERLHVYGFLDYPDYCAMLQSADLVLDSWGWSGGLTSLDALCLGVPVLTLPGALMRGRQTFAMLQRVGVPELMARDTEDYIHRAIHLGGDANARSELLARLQNARALIEADAGARHDVIEFFQGLRTTA